MGLFDLVFDELAKEIKEAPGWLSFVVICNLLLFLPAIKEQLERLSMEKEQTTVATLVAMGLFFLGDVLDTFVFPREGGGDKGEKLLKGSMVVLGAFAVFLLLSRAWLWAVGPISVWIAIIPIYDSRKRLLRSAFKAGIHRATRQKGATRENDSKSEETGFKWLVLKYKDLAKSKDELREKLGIHSGIYNLSKALARKAERYTIKIWFPNEFGKFIRSTAVGTLAASVWLVVHGRQWSAALLTIVFIALLPVFCWLKGLHMRSLYKLAIELVDSKDRYNSPSPCHGVRLFLWDAEIVDCVRAPPDVDNRSAFGRGSASGHDGSLLIPKQSI
jgi:hypothetical protein